MTYLEKFSKQTYLQVQLDGKIYIKLIYNDIDNVKVFSVPTKDIALIASEDPKTTQLILNDYYKGIIAIGELEDVLNEAGNVKQVTIMGYNSIAFYKTITILRENNIIAEMLVNFNTNNIFADKIKLSTLINAIPLNNTTEIIDKEALYSIVSAKDSLIYSILKRATDILLSILTLTILSPFLLLVGVFILFHGSNTIFYKPTRVGLKGRYFKMYKFRSMYEDDTTGKKATIKDDPRITPIGRVIRKYNIDELPQLLNVIKGDMSIVGPRPHRVHLSNQLKSEIPGYYLRYLVRPGLTGWAQANGWRGPTETHTQKQQRTLHDIFYVAKGSYLFDFKIMLLTLFGKKARKNAF